MSFAIFLLLFSNGLFAQVIDENTSQSTTFIGVGEDGTDYLAQSFIADVRQVTKIGAWLRPDAGGGEVTLMLVPDDGSSRPNLATVFHQSALITPDPGGAMYIDSGFTAVIEPGIKYWVVVDGYQNLVSSGFSAVGISADYTDTNEPAFFSDDGGASWDSVPGSPMAVYVEGDTCTFSISIAPNTPIICPNSGAELSVNSGYLGYSWSHGATSAEVVVMNPGVYNVTVVDQNYCVAEASTTVLVGSAPDLNLDSLVTICEGDTWTLNVNPFYSEILWSTGQTVSEIEIWSEGIYWVEATSTSGCRGRDSSTININHLPEVSLGNDTTICHGNAVTLYTDQPLQSYLWSNGQTTDTIQVAVNQDIHLQFTDSFGCTGFSDTISITVNPLPDKPTISEQDGNIVSSFAFGYIWFLDGDTLFGENGQSITSPVSGTYSVSAINGFGCYTLSDSLVFVEEVVGDFISEGFSPNGDGLNETFFVEGIDRYPGNELVVFNRWGDEVYRKTDYANDWDGRGPGGKALPDGNYYYILDLKNGQAITKGVVLINR